MIQIGAAYSPALIHLLETNAIDIDTITIYGRQSIETMQQALHYKPVLLHDVSSHFWLNYEDPFADTAAVAHAEAMLKLAQSPWFSTGIGASAEPQGHTSPFWRGADASQLQPRQRVIENIRKQGHRLRQWAKVPLLLENYNYHPTNAYEYICEPDLFSQLIEEIDCGVLLDLAHARISAYNMGWGDPQSYLAALPLDKVREIHFCRPGLRDGQMLDLHESIQEDDLELLVWVIERTVNLRVVTLESDHPSQEALMKEMELLRSILSISLN